MRSWIEATSEFGERVKIVNDRKTSPSGRRHVSYKPAIANNPPSLRRITWGTFAPRSPFHS